MFLNASFNQALQWFCQMKLFKTINLICFTLFRVLITKLYIYDEFVKESNFYKPACTLGLVVIVLVFGIC